VRHQYLYALLTTGATFALTGCPANDPGLPSLGADPGGAPQLAGTWALARAADGYTFTLLTFNDAGHLQQMCYQPDLMTWYVDSVPLDGQTHQSADVSVTAAGQAATDGGDVIVRLAWNARRGGDLLSSGDATAGLTRADDGLTAEGFLATDCTQAGERLVRVDPLVAQWLSDDQAGCLGDDAFEENDTAETAAALDPGTYAQLRAFDEDWYKLVVPEGKVGTVLVAWDPRFGSLDLQGYAENGVDEAGGPFTGPNTYLVRVMPPVGAIQPDYALVVQLFTEDAYEENDTQETAAVIDAGEYDLTVLDDDWFRVEGDAAAIAQVALDFTHETGDLDLELYDADGVLLASSATGADTETASGFTLSGTFLIHVFGYGGQANTARMTVTVTPIREDQWEENDTMETAAPLGPGTYEISVLDDDWFRVSVGESAALQVTLDFDNDLGDVDLELYDGDGRLLALSMSTSDSEVANGFAPDGEFLIHVYCYAGINRATLAIRATPITDDQFEENDTQAAAAPIAPGTYEIVAIDEDWFRVSVGGPAQLDVTLDFENDLGDVDLALLDGAGDMLAVSETITDHEAVSGFSATGEFLIQVYPYAGANRCTMTVVATPQ
jgi:hypothetical protein